MKYDDRGLRKVKHDLVFRVAETTYEWPQTQRIIKQFEFDYNTRIVSHPLGRYVYAYHDNRYVALAVCEYSDFAQTKERDILTAFPARGRMGKLALYHLLNHVIGTTPQGWQAAGFVATNHAPMRKMIEDAGFRPKLIMYTKEIT